MKKNENRKIIQCDESSSQVIKNPCAVKVKKEDLLFYYFVNSCMTVTLIFKDFMLGGHVSAQDPKNDKVTPARNLKKNLQKMFDLDKKKKQKPEKVSYVGNCGLPDKKFSKNKIDWETEAANELIKKNFKIDNLDSATESTEKSKNIVFDLKNNKFYMVDYKEITEEDTQDKIVGEILKNQYCSQKIIL
ncbi:MAG: hypothetical protein PVG39_22230 [Desulfobacteraceae bacterium]